ncbi:hypothetical protein NIES2135_61550 (plasmid) [Leptolyngbya boryana NIES-2135]|uniref:Uncharacterized protein n=1 Tax=Leptolyngbya boryana NIES-2135 TaxID=1973484 RepID=A0A1Z4JRI7_LEPBY|nr:MULTISPECIES: hypothetical protein [Leptolyngbya]BAY59278.1 hypothetical protein NIES2135_61550 [Leptolyngbya boryana NIES-2135]MBD2372866.1 hypothetical protein [Leptolyngbya sp. FACHB-238]MBD2397381.1 hypothetical protein [Leptolyngbya sp. FACHB-239]MBD2403814.1 hypothetical protein [Leptolyngbya sp. FACHB-402]ULP33470.1 hypothetical protein MCP04_30540 [Leptolyngbya boryana IU 594]
MPTRRTTTTMPQPVTLPQQTTYSDDILMYDAHGHAVPVGQEAIVYRSYRDVNPHTNPNAVIDWAWQGSSILFRRPVRTLFGGALILLVLVAGWNIFTGTLLVAIGAAKPVSLGQIRDKTSVSQVSYAIGSSFVAPVARGTTATFVRVASETAPEAVLVDDRKATPQQDDLDRALTEVRYTRQPAR